MCNCGKKRNLFTQQTSASRPVIATQQSMFMQKKEPALFEYTGSTALSVIGNITRKNYRFHFSGDKQYIEASDAAAMMAIPVLKKII
ncbi:MAG: hypothetical protein ABJB05_11925 [Parafilimonas sp.]